MDLIDALAAIPAIGPLLPYIVLAVAIAAFISPLLPVPTVPGSRLYAVVYAVINALAVNVGHARNAGAPPVTLSNKLPGALALGGLLTLGCLALSACSTTQVAAVQSQAIAAAQLPAGQLFCQVEQAGGGTALVAVANAELGAGPMAVIATGATKAAVDAVCAAAGGVPAPGPTDLSTVVIRTLVTGMLKS